MRVRLLIAMGLASAILSVGLSGRASADPHPEARIGASSAAVEAWLLSEAASDGPVDYALTWIDLSADGQAEAIVYLSGSAVCGSGGCSLYVLQWEGTALRVRARTTVTRTPIYVLESRAQGWRDLAVNVCGGGTTACYQARLSFDGSKYPSNPTTAPRVGQLGMPTAIFLPELGLRRLRP